MREAWFAVPGDLATATGGYAYARRLSAELPAAGWRARDVRLPAAFPFPSAVDLERTGRILKEIPRGFPVIVDGLAFGAMPRRLLDDADHRWIALVHHPLAQESGLDAETVAALRSSERTALAVASAVVATSRHTAATLAAEYGVPENRLRVALPGTDPAPRARGSDGAPCLLSVATVTARKGHDVLVQGLARVRDIAWSARIVGSLERDPATAARVKALIRECGLDGRIVLAGEVPRDTLQQAYAGADVFVLPSRHEGYGMAFAEALAHGLPVIGCSVGAVPDTVPADAGILVPADDVAALAQALRDVLSDHPLRKRISDAAWEHGRMLPTWRDTAQAFAAALDLVGP